MVTVVKNGNGQSYSEQPMVSVCIPVFNGSLFIEETINSVLCQDYCNLEIVVQDNASTDGTWDLLQLIAAKHSQLSIARNETNVGMAPNWNLCINRAKGDYLMLLSADDLLEKGFLHRCLQIFEREKVDAVTTNHFWLQNVVKKQRKMMLPSKLLCGFSGLILLKNPFSINFSLFTHDAVDRMRRKGRFFCINLFSCDYEMWIRFGLSGMRLYYTEEPLGVYRVHNNNLSRQVMRMHRHAAMAVLKYSKELKLTCSFAYFLTLIRFLYRILSCLVRYRKFDKRQFKVLWAHLFR